jgi:hypothetical protein
VGDGGAGGTGFAESLGPRHGAAGGGMIDCYGVNGLGCFWRRGSDLFCLCGIYWGRAEAALGSTGAEWDNVEE